MLRYLGGFKDELHAAEAYTKAASLKAQGGAMPASLG